MPDNVIRWYLCS